MTIYFFQLCCDTHPSLSSSWTDAAKDDAEVAGGLGDPGGAGDLGEAGDRGEVGGVVSASSSSWATDRGRMCTHIWGPDTNSLKFFHPCLKDRVIKSAGHFYIIRPYSLPLMGRLGPGRG